MKAFWALSYQLAKGKNALIFHQAIGIARLKFNGMGKALRVEGDPAVGPAHVRQAVSSLIQEMMVFKSSLVAGRRFHGATPFI